MILAPAPAPTAQPDPIHRQQCLDQAARCRRLAYTISDRETSTRLLSLAAEYERNAWSPRRCDTVATGREKRLTAGNFR